MRNGRIQPPAPDDSRITQEMERISELDLTGAPALWRATFKKGNHLAL